MKIYLKKNIFTLFVLISMVILYLLIPSQIRENMIEKSMISPRLFPSFAIVCAMLSCALLLIIDAWECIAAVKKGEKLKLLQKKDNVSYIRVVLVIILLLLWYAFFEKIGYIISTTVVLFVMTIILGNRNKWSMVLVPVLFSLLTYYAFAQLLHVNLPEILF